MTRSGKPDVRSDTSGNVWGFRDLFLDGTVVAFGVNGWRHFDRDRWESLTPVPASRLHLYPTAVGPGMGRRSLEDQ